VRKSIGWGKKIKDSENDASRILYNKLSKEQMATLKGAKD
jgi:hypothetical protein